MLRKMYLVSPDQVRDTKQLTQPPSSSSPAASSTKNEPSRKQKQPKTSIKKKNNKTKASRKQPPRHKHKKKKTTRVTETLHPLDEWIAYRKKMEESALKREALINEISKFLGRVLPKHAPLSTVPPSTIKTEPDVRTVAPTPRQFEEAIPVLPSTSSTPSSDVIIETPKRAVVAEIQDSGDDDNGNLAETEAKIQLFSKKQYGPLASPFLSPYLKESRLLDTEYGIRREGEDFKIGNATVTVDNMSNLTIKGKHFKGTEDLWTLLTRKNVNYNAIDKNELQKYKTILELTNAHLKGYRSGGDIRTSRGTKFKNVIVQLFPEAKTVLKQKWTAFKS